MSKYDEIKPASKKQRMFLSSECDYTLFGGAAGSGKTYVGLMSILKYVDDKYFRAVVFRRFMPEIEMPGGLWDTAVDLYTRFDSRVKVREKPKTITFPSGAVVKFTHLEQEKTKYSHQGGQYTYILFDEATHFTQTMVEYLGTRLRSPRCKYKPHMKLVCNPDYNSWLRHWVEPYLDDRGIPDRSKDGMVRYFVVQDSKYIWSDSREELEVIYGTGPDSGITSFTFISATCEDNPPLLEADPAYISRLKAKPRVEMERLLLGSWYAREEKSGYFKREWLTPVNLYDQDIVSYCRAWDIAGTLPTDAFPNPDWTAGVLIAKTRHGRYIIVDAVRFRARYGEVVKQIINTARGDPEETRIILPQEPGQAGKAAGMAMISTLLGEGFPSRMRPSNKSKVIRFQPFASAAEAGLVDYVEGSWTDDYFTELELFDGSRNIKDDQVDATSDAFITLAQKVEIPPFMFGLQQANLTQENPFIR
jgi:predicted phage terminase large subunit-like protein